MWLFTKASCIFVWLYYQNQGHMGDGEKKTLSLRCATKMLSEDQQRVT